MSTLHDLGVPTAIQQPLHKTSACLLYYNKVSFCRHTVLSSAVDLDKHKGDRSKGSNNWGSLHDTKTLLLGVAPAEQARREATAQDSP